MAATRDYGVSILLLALVGCGHNGGARRGDVIVSMTRLSVAPKPESGEHWDRGVEEGDAGGCGLIGALSGFVAPGTGPIAAGVCEFVSRSGEGSDLKPEDPDLFVGFSAGGHTYRSPVIPNRHSHDRPFELFVPGALLRGDLRVAVYDLDGVYPADATLIADAMVSGSALRDGVELKEPRLELLRLEARSAAGVEEEIHLKTSAADGLVPVDGLEIPAGVLVEVRAQGRYQIGSWNGDTLGPDGYPGGGPQGYNLPGETFERAKHGAAVALLQRDSAAQAVVVGECVRFVAESGGRLLVGVNDNAHRNNTGHLAFDVRVIAPSAEVWSGASAGEGC
jgi:hypothetical protein